MDLVWVFLLFSVSLSHVTAAGFHKFDSAFDTDDIDVEKWRVGANCFHAVDNDGATTGPVNFSIIAIENDPNFHRFDSCAMLSFTDLMSGNIVEVTDVACVQPARASADNTTTDYRRWEFAENIADGTTSAAAGADTNSNCGAYKDGYLIFLAIHCYRDAGFVKEGDAIFLAQCDAAAEEAVVRKLKYGSVNVTDLPSEKLKYHTNVTFDVLDGDNDCDYANDVLKSIFDLGDKVRLRICILIDGSKGDTRTAFADGLDAMGLVITNCTAKRADSQPINSADPDTQLGTDGQLIIGENACGTGEYNSKEILTTLYGMRFVKASTDGDNPFSRSPNCYYSPFYEAVSFVGETIQLSAATRDRKTILTCNIARYCTASTDTSCFGDKSGTIDADGNPNSTGWPTCPTPGYQATRRKRSVFDDRLDDLPDTVDTEFTVRLGGGGGEPKAKSDCFRKSTFYILTAVLVVLMIVTLVIGAVLFFKLRSSRSVSGSSSHRSKKTMREPSMHGSQHSKSGYWNKAYSDRSQSYYH